MEGGPAGGPDARLSRRVAGHGPGDAGRGRQLFIRACASCHGQDGLGGKDKVGPINEPAFLALISDQAVRRTIITGRGDLKDARLLPAWRGVRRISRPLGETDVDDLRRVRLGLRGQPGLPIGPTTRLLR